MRNDTERLMRTIARADAKGDDVEDLEAEIIERESRRLRRLERAVDTRRVQTR